MKQEPTYSAKEIREMVTNTDMKAKEMKIIANLINEEIGLYATEDMPDIMQASMILFTRALISKSIKM